MIVFILILDVFDIYNMYGNVSSIKSCRVKNINEKIRKNKPSFLLSLLYREFLIFSPIITRSNNKRWERGASRPDVENLI